MKRTRKANTDHWKNITQVRENPELLLIQKAITKTLTKHDFDLVHRNKK